MHIFRRNLLTPEGKFGLMSRLALGVLAVVTSGISPLQAQTDFVDSRYFKAVTQDAPAYRWSFEELWDTKMQLGKVNRVAGPTEKISTTLGGEHQAIQLPGDGSRLVVKDEPGLRFKNGDGFTAEAWVRLDKIGSGASAYLISKGRTTSSEDNQNWAFRLQEKGGSARLSFLFRSQGGEVASQYHRWVSDDGIPADGKWHHVSMVYEFGKPNSARGFINGQKQKGKWDMGGATDREPVVDEAPVWIGSSRGGAVQNSLNGAVDEIAIYRKALPDATLQKRYQRVILPALAADLSKVAPDQVLVEIREGSGKRATWSDVSEVPTEVFGISNFALTSLPQVYNERAARRDRTLSLHLRLAGRVALPAGKHTLLFRTPGLSRLKIDGKQVLDLPYLHISGSAHGVPRDQSITYEYPKPHMGTHEKHLEIEGGKTVLLEAEGQIGDANRRLSLNEFLVAIRFEGQNAWQLLGSEAGKPVPFETEAYANLLTAQEQQFTKLEEARRDEAMKAWAKPMAERHTYAKRYIDSLPPVVLPKTVKAEASVPEVIDAFLLAKIDEAKANAGNQKHVSKAPHHLEAIRILENKCFQCHGEKSSGGLKLNTREAALAEGKSGQVAVIPGDPDQSEVLYRILTDDPDEVMPPEGKGLTPEEIEITRRWIAEGAPWAAADEAVDVPAKVEPLELLRRLYLNTVGVMPTAEEIRAFEGLPEASRVSQTVDRLVEDPRFADHWVSYWQDALAENPRLIKPVLNNTGPFRYWLHEALLDNKPMDQFAADLITFQGSVNGGGAGGFIRAAENDVPMAAKAHVLGNAFLGVEMKCARCHDSPYHSTKQEDLFAFAAMLSGKPVSLPESSSVPAEFFQREGKSNSVVKVTLKPGSAVDPNWPFQELVKSKPGQVDVAWEITRPENHRFAQVLVNRVWKQYFGQAFVEPVHDWEGNEPSHSELLDYLSREFVRSGYDLRELSKMILKTEAFQRESRFAKVSSPKARFMEAPLRRRFSAEQMVDSLINASGIPNYSEELTFDMEGLFKSENFLNMGRPKRAWQMISTASDRDRPTLSLPNAESIIAVMSANGWRDERPEPVSERQNEASVLQPGVLGNGIFGIWLTRLSDHSELTKLAVQATSAEQLVENLFLRFLTRYPSAEEKAGFVALIQQGFETRLKVDPAKYEVRPYVPLVREISWSNHLSQAAAEIAAERESQAFRGPEPTKALDSAWRESFEDAVWAILNSPELPFVP